MFEPTREWGSPTQAAGRWLAGGLVGLAIGLGVVVLGWFATPVVFALLALWARSRLGRIGLGGLLAAAGTVWTLLYFPGVLSGCGGGSGGVSGGAAGTPVTVTCSVSDIWVWWAVVGIVLALVGVILTVTAIRRQSLGHP